MSQPQVLIAVQSGPKNKELRNEVRRTWGGACKTVHQSWCSVIFVLGMNQTLVGFGKNIRDSRALF